MARDISNFIRIAIPLSLLATLSPVQQAVSTLTKATGGATATQGNGSWYDDSGTAHIEDIVVFQWNFASQDFQSVDSAARELVDAIFSMGEQAVLKERHYDNDIAYIGRTTAGYAARILFAPTKH